MLCDSFSTSFWGLQSAVKRFIPRVPILDSWALFWVIFFVAAYDCTGSFTSTVFRSFTTKWRFIAGRIILLVGGLEHHPHWLSLHHFSEGLGSTTNQLRNGSPARHLWFPEGIPVDWFYVCRIIHPYYLVSWGVLQHGKAVQQPCRYPMFCLVCGYRKSYIEIIESDTPCGIFHDFFMTYPLVNVHIVT